LAPRSGRKGPHEWAARRGAASNDKEGRRASGFGSADFGKNEKLRREGNGG